MTRHHPQQGFTLVELIISVGLFAIVMLVAAGAYLVMLNVNRQAQAYSSGVNNLAFALELVTREIRISKSYTCMYTLDGMCKEIRVTDVNGATVYYSTYSRQSEGDLGSSRTNTQAIGRYSSGSQLPLTDSAYVTITNLDFYLSGQSPAPGDYIQPYVTVVARGTVAVSPTRTETFDLESSAVMRGTDIAP